MSNTTNLEYTDFSAGQVAGSGLGEDGDLYFDLG